MINALDSLTALASINGYGHYQSLATSNLVNLMVSKQQLGPLELIDIVALLLPRNTSTLIALDIRFVENAFFTCRGQKLKLLFWQ
jgi:hypothetical protein